MKKLIITFGICLGVMSLFTSCENELEKRYNNPEKSTEKDIPGFFTGVLNNDRVRPSYWNVRTFLLPHPAVYTQTAAFLNGNTSYQQNDDYSGQYWNNFYYPTANGGGIMATYRAMESTYAELSDADKSSQAIFMEASRILLYDQGSQIVDLWGDIPFSEAGSLETQSKIVNAKFDDQAELYNLFIDGLKTSAEFFSTATTNSSFSRYDIMSSGSIAKWQRYANSVRLRLLMRISNVNESKARTEVMEMLNNPGKYPLVDGDNIGNYIPSASDILLQPLTTYTNNLNDGLTELRSHYAPDYMLNTVMNPANDPRIPVYFDKYGRTVNGVFVPNTEYKAMPITFTSNEQETNYPDYAILDSATFLQNTALPGIVMTASEVNFLKAEAYERWGSKDDAKAAYSTALKQSVTFYYYLNNLNSTGQVKVPKPEESVINDFINEPSVALTGDTDGDLTKIWTQKWVHFSFFQSVQAWSELRRTKTPELTFPSNGKLAGYETPPTRLVYPTTEKTYNSENYKDVVAKDTRMTKVFWDVK